MSTHENSLLTDKHHLQVFKGVSLADALEHCRHTLSILSRSLPDLDIIMPEDHLPDFQLTPSPAPDSNLEIESLELLLVDYEVWKFISLSYIRYPELKAQFNIWRESDPDLWTRLALEFQNTLHERMGYSSIADYVTSHPDPTSEFWQDYTPELYDLRVTTTKRSIDRIVREHKTLAESWKIEYARHLTLKTTHSRWKSGFLSTLNEAEQHVLQNLPTLREIKRSFLLRHEGINGIDSARAHWERDWTRIKTHPVPHSKLINLTARHGICYGYDAAA